MLDFLLTAQMAQDLVEQSDAAHRITEGAGENTLEKALKVANDEIEKEARKGGSSTSVRFQFPCIDDKKVVYQLFLLMVNNLTGRGFMANMVYNGFGPDATPVELEISW